MIKVWKQGNQGRMRLYVNGNLEDTALSNNIAIDFSSGTNIKLELTLMIQVTLMVSMEKFVSIMMH